MFFANPDIELPTADEDDLVITVIAQVVTPTYVSDNHDSCLKCNDILWARGDTFWMSSRGLYTVGQTVVLLEAKILDRASRMKNATRARLADVISIDTRNFVLWLLWLEVAQRLLHMSQEEQDLLACSSWQWEPTVREIERLYVIASFPNPCRYTGDSGFDLTDTQEDILREVQDLTASYEGGRADFVEHFQLLSLFLEEQTGRCRVTWSEIEHSEVGLAFSNKHAWYNGNDEDLLFTWNQNSSPQVCFIAPTKAEEDDSSLNPKDEEQPSNSNSHSSGGILSQQACKLAVQKGKGDLLEVFPSG